SSCWVGLMFCATRSDFDVASDELCALAGSPASPRAITKILADAKRRSMSVPPEEISNFAKPCPKSNLAQACNPHVRFTPKSGHWVARLACPLWAKSGHMQCKSACPLASRRPNFCQTTFDSGFGTQNDACCDPVLSK